jgi:hypothetical protein
MLNEFRNITQGTEQMKRSIIASKYCFTNFSLSCAEDKNNDDCWCWDFCVESSANMAVMWENNNVDILQSSEN